MGPLTELRDRSPTAAEKTFSAGGDVHLIERNITASREPASPVRGFGLDDN